MKSVWNKIHKYCTKIVGIGLLTGMSLGVYNLFTQDGTSQHRKLMQNRKNEAISNEETLEKKIQKLKKEIYDEKFYNIVLASLCGGSLALLGMSRQRKKKKGLLKPKNVKELVSLPLDAILKYKWPASAAAGLLVANKFSYNLPDEALQVLHSNFYAYKDIGYLATLYVTIPTIKLFLEQLSFFKKPFLTSFPKALLYSLMKSKASLQGDEKEKNRCHKKTLEQMEDVLEKKLEEQVLNFESATDRACYNLTKLLEEKTTKNHLIDLQRIVWLTAAKVDEHRTKRILKKNPEKLLPALMDLQQTYLILDNESKIVKISQKIFSECRKHKNMLPVLINQAKILDYYNQDSSHFWKNAIKLLLKEYNLDKDFRQKGGSQSEVLELKKKATISGANTLIIERSDDYHKIQKVDEISKYLYNTTKITPKPLAFLDLSSLPCFRKDFIRKYYLFMERKPGVPININNTDFLENNIYKILEVLALYQTKATQNLKHLRISLPAIDYMQYFENKFLRRINADEETKQNLQYGIKPIVEYLQAQKAYFNHFNLHEKNILADKKDITFIDSEDAELASFGIDLGFLANHLKFREALIKPYHTIFGKKHGFSKKEFEKQAYSAMVLATGHLIGRNIAYNEGRESEFMLNLYELAEKLPEYYPKQARQVESFRKGLDKVFL